MSEFVSKTSPVDQSNFLDDLEWRSLSEPKLSECKLALGQGSGALEVVVCSAAAQPQQAALRQAWSNRHKGRGVPVLMVWLYGQNEAALCGPGGEQPPVHLGLSSDQVARICRTALAEPDRHSAARFLNSVLAQIDESPIPGLRNEGLFAMHELMNGVRGLPNWTTAAAKAEQVLPKRGRQLLGAMGYQVADSNQPFSILRAGQTKLAVAVFLDRTEDPDFMSARFGGMSPVQYALSKADEENLDYVVVDHGSALRVYTASSGKGVGRRGRSETFIETHLDLLRTQDAGYLWLLFSSDALVKGGTFDQILDRSHDYATDLGSRLRERIYNEVVPQLSLAIAQARKLKKPTVEDLATTYEMTLLVLFRLLFVSYAEDKNLLPYRTNDLYRKRSLKTHAHELVDRLHKDGDRNTWDDSTSLWNEIVQLFNVVDNGKPREWGVPGYNGGMFSTDARTSPAGALLKNIELPNNAFGPVLSHLLVDNASEGPGPVDFRSLGVREFGTIYEGLLESELSVAETDLYLDEDGVYVPKPPKKGLRTPAVPAGRIYLHNASGARKSTGSYYTKSFAVEHLLQNALEPALASHLGRLDQLDDTKAAASFFDFRVADIAMGSGHFLVAAVDRIEARLSSYLARRALPGVTNELSRLREAALNKMTEASGSETGIEIENIQLLRRQVARRCIYGVDLNPIAVQLARLSLWIHTFVPGLPLSFLDRNIVCGNSLVGIATLDELNELLGIEEGTLYEKHFKKMLEPVLGQIEKLAKLSDADAGQIQAAREAFTTAKLAAAETEAKLTLFAASRLPAMEYKPSATDLDGMSVTRFRELQKKAKEVLGDIKPFHFPVAFPEVFLRERSGFDVILGNPPWDKLRFEAQQFWVTRVPGLNALAAEDRDKQIDRLRRERPDDAKIESTEIALRESMQLMVDFAYDLQGRGRHGHHDYAKLFCERALKIIAIDGELGYVLPRSSLVIGGWADLRRALVERGRLTTLQARNRGGWLFTDVHGQLTIVLMTSGRSRGSTETIAIWPAVTSEEALLNASMPNALQLLGTEVRELTDSWVIPWFSGGTDRPVFDKMRGKSRLGGGAGWIQGTADSSRWDFSGTGPHSKFAATKDSGKGWRVLMTRHVDGYRIVAETPFQRFIPFPRKLVDLELGVIADQQHVIIGPDHPVIIYRYPTMNDNTRTMIATVLPEEGYLYSKGYVHGLRAPGAEPVEILALLGYMNSMVGDWWVRRFTDRHLTLPVLANLPLPEWSAKTRQRVAGYVGTLLTKHGVNRLAGGVNVPTAGAGDSASEEDLLARIEAQVAMGFGLSADEWMGVTEDFSDKACAASMKDAVVKLLKAQEKKA